MDVVLKEGARKALHKIGSNDISKVKRKLQLLSTNPLSGKVLQGGYHELRSLRAWPLRILYTFNPNTQMVTIEAIEYRGQVYK